MQVRSWYVGIVIVAVGLLLSTRDYSAPRASAQAQTDRTISSDCDFLRGSDEAKRIAKYVWSRPYGPSKKDRQVWSDTRRCARSEYQRVTRFPNIWKAYKQKLQYHRYVGRLESACDQSPTSAVMKCIDLGAVVHNVPATTLYRIAGCESGYDPYAGNPSGATGLFQFIPSTWNTTVSRMIQAGERIKNKINSAKWNALAAAWKISNDGTGEWVCQ